MQPAKDIQKLNKLFEMFQPALFSYCNHLIHSEEDAREIVNDVFINIWNKRSELNLDETLKAYLYAGVKNRAFNHLRDKKQVYTPLSDISEKESNIVPITEHLQALETEKLVFALIDQLPEKCRQIFIMSRRDNLTYKQIAELLEINIKTVENQISIAIKFIKKGLEKSDTKGNYLHLLPWLALWLGTN